KQTILLFAFLAGMVTTQAQTEEETIAWITEKLQQHFGNEQCNVKITQVTPCDISFVLICGEQTNEYQFNPSMSEWTGTENVIATAGAIIKVIRKGRYDSGKTEYISDLWFSEKGTPGIKVRLVKALNHLATFCREKKEEPF